MKYCIAVQEILRKEVVVEADSIDEACDLVQQKYDNEEIVLDSEDLLSIELFGNCDWQHPESLIEDWVVNGEWEKCGRCRALFDCQMHDSYTNCRNPVLSDEPWYVEKWNEEDLIAAMERAKVHITRENLDKLKDACKDIFEDKTLRNEMLEDKASELFEEVWMCQ